MRDDVMVGCKDARIVMQRCRWAVAVDVRWMVALCMDYGAV